MVVLGSGMLSEKDCGHLPPQIGRVSVRNNLAFLAMRQECE